MSNHQEIEGLLSPLIRDIRLKQVASSVPPKSAVLDLACGNLYLGRHLPTGCSYHGVDRQDAGSENAKFDFLKADLEDRETPDKIEKWLSEPVDIITSVAFLEHLDEPAPFVETYAKLLKPGGLFIGTTPHPRGRHLHDGLSKLYLCSRSGAEEHEEFLSREDLQKIAKAAGGEMIEFRQFLFGLNQLFVFKFPA